MPQNVIFGGVLEAVIILVAALFRTSYYPVISIMAVGTLYFSMADLKGTK